MSKEELPQEFRDLVGPYYTEEEAAELARRSNGVLELPEEFDWVGDYYREKEAEEGARMLEEEERKEFILYPK